MRLLWEGAVTMRAEKHGSARQVQPDSGEDGRSAAGRGHLGLSLSLSFFHFLSPPPTSRVGAHSQSYTAGEDLEAAFEYGQHILPVVRPSESRLFYP